MNQTKQHQRHNNNNRSFCGSRNTTRIKNPSIEGLEREKRHSSNTQLQKEKNQKIKNQGRTTSTHQQTLYQTKKLCFTKQNNMFYQTN